MRTATIRLVFGIVIACCTLISNASAQSNQEIRKYTNVKYMVWQVQAGNYEKAIELCEKRLQKNPDELEPLFGLAMAYGQMGQIEKAMGFVKRAVEGGMPFERFLVGPRKLLEPLSTSKAFRAYAKGHTVELLHGPMLGDVTTNSAKFWVRTRKETPVQIRLQALDQPSITSSPVTTTEKKDFTAIISVDNLKPDTPYRYEVLIDGNAVSTQQLPEFRTTMLSDTKTRFHIGFGGGANYNPRNERMWDTVLSRAPRAFLFLGDNSYFNIPDVAAHQRYFFYRRHSRPEYRRMIASTAMYAIYDDHDFGGNDSIGGPEIDMPPWKRNVTLKTLRENFLNPYYGGGQENPGCWTD
ncbi:MAG: tetratricopeptide repeat protein, partial [Candidatus Latescibacteria bacterium]|nr:tetratricopeptide repeat protein [Candidatus Latescibacterota bacterium]